MKTKKSRRFAESRPVCVDLNDLRRQPQRRRWLKRDVNFSI